MAYQMSASLPPAPPEFFDAAGQPRIGAYHGSTATIDLRPRLGGGLRGRVRELLTLKRWVWGGIATPDVFVGFALVDAGLAANGFCYAVDLRSGDRVADISVLGLPGALRLSDRPGDGLSANLSASGTKMRVYRPRGTFSIQVDIRSGDFALEALLDVAAAPDALSVLMPVKNGDLDFTQKTTLMPSAGTVRVGTRSWSLASGFGGVDFTHGLFARLTAWRWGFALGRTDDGTPVAFNLADGISGPGASENAVWIDRTLAPVGPARFIFDAKHLDAPWQVQTDDGAVDLRFAPKGMHREYVVLQSHFAQIAGVFSGTIKGPGGQVHKVSSLPGVAEDQRVLW